MGVTFDDRLAIWDRTVLGHLRHQVRIVVFFVVVLHSVKVG